MSSTDFPHLSLQFVAESRARLTGGGKPDHRTQQAKLNRQGHAANLQSQFSDRIDEWQGLTGGTISAGVPLLLRLDQAEDADELCRKLGLELVGEDDDGFVVAALADVDAADLNQAIAKFLEGSRGGGAVAMLHEFASTQDRLGRLLSATLLARWPALQDLDVFDLVVSLSAGSLQVGAAPEQRGDETDAAYARRIDVWRNDKLLPAIQRLDDQRETREAALRAFLRSHDAVVGEIVDGPPCSEHAEGSETFDVAMQVSGKCLRDLALNFPFVLEIAEAEEVSTEAGDIQGAADLPARVDPPSPDAPTVCVVDSGIQESHPLVAPAINRARSMCFVPGLAGNVADEVRDGGHGTRVAATVAFEPEDGRGAVVQSPCWIENCRVLDATCGLPARVPSAGLVNAVVDHFGKNTRLFVHAITGQPPGGTQRMSAWATALDDRSHRDGVLFIQAAGNASWGPAASPFVPTLQAFRRDRYPKPLVSDGRFRIPNPAQALHVLTVGAVATSQWQDANHATLALPGQPATYSRVGPGLWNSIKPDVVVPVGDYAFHNNGHNPVLNSNTCKPLVRKAAGAAPLVAADAVGTSFAAPRVARLAAQLATHLPDEPVLLYRALIVQSARWPGAISQWPLREQVTLVGHGLIDEQRALGNAEHRVTLVTSGEHAVRARQARVYTVPVPRAMRGSADESLVRVEITLAYTAAVRRKRRGTRRYLAVWADWKASKKGERRSAFEARVFRDGNADDRRQDDGMPWTLGGRHDHGEVEGYRFNSGTVQKDWADVPAYSLPEEFMIAVVGHPGWDKDPEAEAKFALVVSFESLDQSIPVYAEHVRLRQRIGAGSVSS